MNEDSNTPYPDQDQSRQTSSAVKSLVPERLRALVRTILAPKRDRRVVAWSIGVLVVGALTSLVGIALIGGRRSVAQHLLGANFMMGMPLAQADAAKVQLAGCGGFLVFAFGGLVFAVSLIIALMQLAKSE